MGLKIKGFNEILKGMVDWTVQKSTRLVDFTVGSVLRTVYEAVATEIEEFYYWVYQNFLWAVENSIYQSFNFTKQEATKAYGDLMITFTTALPADLFIPIGTKFATRATSRTLYYETTQNYLIPAGSTYALILIECTEAGTVGNVAANTITGMVNPISYVASVSNPSAFITGVDEETDEARKERFSLYISSRSRGTRQAILYALSEVPEVSGFYIDDSQIGIVTIYAHDVNGDLPSLVKSKIEEKLEDYRPAGIPYVVRSFVQVNPAIVVELTVPSVYNNEIFRQFIHDKINQFLLSLGYGETLYISDLTSYIRRLDRNGIINCRVTSPSSDVHPEAFQLIRGGSIEITMQEVTS